MKKLITFLACSIALSGCGGAGSLLGLASPFEGIWAGTWDGDVSDGPVSFTVDLFGQISGTMHSNLSGEDSPFNGAILENGNATVTINFPSQSESIGTGGFALNGGQTAMSGTLTFDGEAITFDLDRT